jgi:hypothetical protein
LDNQPNPNSNKGNPPPLPQLRAFGRNIHQHLYVSQIVGYPHDIPKKAYKIILKFNGGDMVKSKEHLQDFWKICIELKGDKIEDVMIKLLV